ncbi:hypothetical protein IFM89_006560 [Coptis chinensis]|uniref:Uncharacterized protein n=1 Tax=Coptis chinensis TaxID=261450 RepID=A0A835M4J1_9MAGN|nr:hypothetical protein IFM89_006560 [Coptis chinensis]
MVNTKDEPDHSEIKKRAQNALNVHQRGDHSRAVSLIEKSLSKFKRYPNSCGDLYRVQAAIYKDLVDKCTVWHNKKNYVKNAVESERRNKIRRRTSGLKTSDANNRVPLQGTSEQDRSSIASDGQTVLGSARALGEDLGQQELKEEAVIPTLVPMLHGLKIKDLTLKQSCGEDVSSVDNTEAGSNSHIQKEIMRKPLCEAAQFDEDLEKQEEQSQLEMQEAAAVPTQDSSEKPVMYSSHSESRNPAVDWIPDGNDQLLLHGTAEQEQIEGDFLKYIAKVKNPAAWGGATEIQMACHVHK